MSIMCIQGVGDSLKLYRGINVFFFHFNSFSKILPENGCRNSNQIHKQLFLISCC